MLIKKVKSEGKNLKKRSGESKLIAELVLCAVAVGLCVVYRQQIGTVLSNVFTSIGTAITGLFK